MLVIAQPPNSLQEELGCIQPAWITVVEESSGSLKAEESKSCMNVNETLSTFSYCQIECCCPDPMPSRLEEIDNVLLDVIHQTSTWR